MKLPTIMKVSELLRKMILANDADKYGIIPPMRTIPVRTVAPKRSMYRKSAVFPLNEFSSRSLQYLARKNIWNMKSKSAQKKKKKPKDK